MYKHTFGMAIIHIIPGHLTFTIGIWRAGGCKWKKGDEEEVESEREKRKREKVDMDVEKRET